MKKTSRIISLFIVLTVLLSTVTVTIPVSAADTIIWEEDFEGDTSFTSAEGWQNCYVTNNSGGTSGADAEKNYVKIEDGKIVFKKTRCFSVVFVRITH